MIASMDPRAGTALYSKLAEPAKGGAPAATNPDIAAFVKARFTDIPF